MRVVHGHSRASQTAASPDTRRLTPDLKRPPKRLIAPLTLKSEEPPRRGTSTRELPGNDANYRDPIRRSDGMSIAFVEVRGPPAQDPAYRPTIGWSTTNTGPPQSMTADETGAVRRALLAAALASMKTACYEITTDWRAVVLREIRSRRALRESEAQP